jgi:hypothetical protein
MKKQLMMLALALPSAVWAGGFEDRKVAYNKEKSIEAFN